MSYARVDLSRRPAPSLGAGWLPAVLLFAATLVVFAVRSVHGIHFLTFGDESGHFVGARAIHAGDRLYRDFIDAHGPIVFMVAHAFGALFGWDEPLDARWAMVAFAALAGGSVVTSAALQGPAARLWAGALFFGAIATPWLVQALNMVNYHLIGGALVTITLAWLVVPAWTGAEIARYRALVSGVCLALLCGTAYSLAPTALLLAASAVISLHYGYTQPQPRSLVLFLLLGFLSGGLLILAWLLRYGDPIGYLVFHIINNQVNYARYSTFGWYTALASMLPSSAPSALVQSMASIVCAAGFLMLLTAKSPAWAMRPRLRLATLALIFVAVLMLNFRGATGFQNGSFVVAGIAVFSLSLPIIISAPAAPHGFKAWLATACLGVLLCGFELTCRLAVNSPWGAARQDYIKWPTSSLAVDLHAPIFRQIRAVLRPDERLLVLVYNPDFYLAAGFLPIHKFHEYLPWEADYARAPWFGRDRDLCAELIKNPPPVIVYDGWIVWGTWKPEGFIPCLKPLLTQHYSADPIPTLFIRRDRLP